MANIFLNTLQEWFTQEGLSFLGIIEAKTFPEQTAEYSLWLEKQHHGTMDYLAKHFPFKFNPALILKGCESLIIVGLNYYQPPVDEVPNGYGKVAQYAWGRDYHKVLQQKLKRLVVQLKTLFPAESFVSGVDATPLSESFYAEKAGLGFRGKNSLLINPDFGSWFVLGEIMTTLCCHETFFLINSLKQAKQISLTTKTGCPAGCQRCLKACPTGALYAPYKMDASRCLSYLTIEYKQELVPQSWPNLKNWLFGCDICQAVCPFNRHPLLTTEKDFLHHKSGSLLNLSWILSIKNDEEYKTLFAGSPLMRAGRGRLLRNALIVAANTRVNAVKQLIRPLCSDNEPLIAKHAVQAYALLTS